MNRTVTLPTVDYGDVTIPEPSWCIGHDPAPQYRTDLFHRGPVHAFALRGRHIGRAHLTQAPFADRSSRLPEAQVTLVLEGASFTPAGLHDLAAAMDAYADQLRALADHLAAILADGGEGR